MSAGYVVVWIGELLETNWTSGKVGMGSVFLFYHYALKKIVIYLLNECDFIVFSFIKQYFSQYG